jgi:putative transposase
VKEAGAVTQPYIHVRGATTSICRRTAFRKAFLAPWDPVVNQIWLYALAEAARVHRVSLHMSKLVVTHHHTDVTPSEANLPAFVHQLHSDVSRGLNELLRARGYDAPGDIWDGRSPHYLRLLDSSAQMAQFIYDYQNPTAAGMVERPEHLPGVQLEFGHWASEGLVIKRPFVFGKTRASETLCALDPSPELMRTFGGDVRAAIHHMEKLSREALREIRAARKRPAMGAQRLKRLHPSDEPRTPAERGGRVPTFRIGARGPVGCQQRIAAATETRAFREQHADVRRRRLAGQDEPFPYGTYGQRVYHGASVSQPYDDALLAQPGALLEEVLAELDTGANEAGDRESVLEEVREDLAHGTRTVVDESELDYRRPDPDAPVEDGERPPPVTMHKNDRRRSWTENPRRLIVRRDSRRGRPPKEPGSDPPSE